MLDALNVNSMSWRDIEMAKVQPSAAVEKLMDDIENHNTILRELVKKAE